MISRLTGITDKMLEAAPTFASIAEDAMGYLEGRVFVAHNVSFDHSFLKREFNEVGIKFLPKKLCTVRLSRKLIPEAPSYGLGRLCGFMGIAIKDRHRAMGDAEATAKLFTMLMARDKDDVVVKSVNRRSREASLPANLPREHFDALPNTVGVYRFMDRSGRHLYVGKAKNIRKRVLSHFTGNGDGRRYQEMKREVYAIEFVETGSELIALLEESHLIRQYWPRLNRAQKFPKHNYVAVHYTDRAGRSRMAIKKLAAMDRPIFRGRNIPELRSEMYRHAEDYGLCHHLVGLQRGVGECQQAEMQDCVCSGALSIEEHNERIKMLMDKLTEAKDEILLLPGRTSHEQGLVILKQGVYQGYAFAPQGAEHIDIRNAIVHRKHSDDVERILSSARRSGGLNTLPLSAALH